MIFFGRADIFEANPKTLAKLSTVKPLSSLAKLLALNGHFVTLLTLEELCGFNETFNPKITLPHF